MSLPVSSLSVTLNIVLSKAKITTVDEFCEKLLCSPTFLCNYIKPDACQVLMRDRLGRPLAADAGSQTIEDTIDVLTAEIIVTEALQIGDEQAAKQAAKQAAAREVAECHALQPYCNVHSVRLRLGSIEQSSVPLERRRLEKQQSSAQKIGRLHGKQQSDKQKMRLLLAKLRRSVHVCEKSAQSSVQPCSGLQRTAPIVHRLECRAQRKMQQLSRLPQARG